MTLKGGEEINVDKRIYGWKIESGDRRMDGWEGKIVNEGSRVIRGMYSYLVWMYDGKKGDVVEYVSRKGSEYFDLVWSGGVNDIREVV